MATSHLGYLDIVVLLARYRSSLVAKGVIEHAAGEMRRVCGHHVSRTAATHELTHRSVLRRACAAPGPLRTVFASSIACMPCLSYYRRRCRGVLLLDSLAAEQQNLEHMLSEDNRAASLLPAAHRRRTSTSIDVELVLQAKDTMVVSPHARS